MTVKLRIIILSATLKGRNIFSKSEVVILKSLSHEPPLL